jgi:hypothetical protein
MSFDGFAAMAAPIHLSFMEVSLFHTSRSLARPIPLFNSAQALPHSSAGARGTCSGVSRRDG